MGERNPTSSLWDDRCPEARRMTIHDPHEWIDGTRRRECPGVKRLSASEALRGVVVPALPLFPAKREEAEW